MTGQDPDAGADAARLGWELSTAVVLFHEAIGQRLELSATEHKALGLITRTGPVTATQLAQHTGLTPGAVTGLVDRLEDAGHVRRDPDPTDRRRILVSAVTGHDTALAEVFAELSREMGAFMAKYDQQELLVIADYVVNTIQVLRAQTRRLTQDATQPARHT